MSDKKNKSVRQNTTHETSTPAGAGRVRKEFIVELDGKPYVLYAGLLQLAHQEGLKSLCTELIQIPNMSNDLTAIVKATAITRKGTFVDYGDANYSSIGDLKFLPHVIRCASTRAKARALRDAVDVGMTSVEELPFSNGAKREARPAEEMISPRQLEVLQDLADKLSLPGGVRVIFPTMTRAQASAKIDEYSRAFKALVQNQKEEGREGCSLPAAQS